jgi:hypothetical protein
MLSNRQVDLKEFPKLRDLQIRDSFNIDTPFGEVDDEHPTKTKDRQTKTAAVNDNTVVETSDCINASLNCDTAWFSIVLSISKSIIRSRDTPLSSPEAGAIFRLILWAVVDKCLR